jgi:predicted amidohydrolase
VSQPILAAVQYSPRLARSPADVRDNFRRAVPLLSMASKIGSSLIVMPELCLTGYSFLGRSEAAAVAEPADGKTFTAFREFAIRSECYVAYGFVEDTGSELHNSAAVVSPRGDMVLLTRKHHLAGSDYLWADPAREPPPIVETDIGRMAAVICRDLKDDAIQEAEGGILGGRPVDIVAGLTNWGKDMFPSSRWVEFASDNKCVLVVSNRWGEEVNESRRHGRFSTDFHVGGSAVIEPGGKVHVGGLRFGEDCVVAARPEVGR